MSHSNRTPAEQRAYLEGKIEGAEVGYRMVPRHLKCVEAYIDKLRRELRSLDIPQLRDHYCTDSVEIPSPWEWDETFTAPVYGKPCFGADHEVHTDLDDEAEPRLGLRKRKPKRVWFEAEESKRLPQKDDWFWGVGKWNQAWYDFVVDPYLCAIRHEEYDEAPQVITQSDVDRLLGGKR